MNTNDNFDSKKIIEEINNLENDETNKKEKRKFGLINFVETVILVVLIIYLVMTVGSQFIEDLIVDNLGYAYDYESYDDYEGYYDDNEEGYDEFSNNEDFYYDKSEFLTTNSSTIEKLMNPDYKNSVDNENVYENTSSSINIDITTQEDTKENIYDEETLLKQEFEVEKDNIKVVQEGMNVNGELLISLENKNTKLVHDLDVYTVFYKSDKIIKVDSQMVECILVNNKKYIKIDETPTDYDRFEVFVDKDSFFEFRDELLHNNLKYDSYIEDDVLQIELKNNGKKIDRANFTILYFDKNKSILDIETVSDFDIGKYLGGNIRGYGVWDKNNSEYVEYDSYEIILDYAGNYNY